MRKLSESFVTAAEARVSLERREVEKLTYEQKICLDYLKKYYGVSSQKTREMVEELQKIGRIDERQASMVANLMPKDKDEVRLIFSKERTTLSDDETAKVLEIVSKHAN